MSVGNIPHDNYNDYLKQIIERNRKALETYKDEETLPEEVRMYRETFLNPAGSFVLKDLAELMCWASPAMNPYEMSARNLFFVILTKMGYTKDDIINGVIL